MASSEEQRLIDLYRSLGQVVHQIEWRESLPPVLRRHYDDFRFAFDQLRYFFEKQSHQPITLEALNELAGLWKNRWGKLTLKSVGFTCDRNYGDYGGVQWRTLDELEAFISDWNGLSDFWKATYSESHSFTVEF